MIYEDIDTDVDCRYRYMFWNVTEKNNSKSYYKNAGFSFLNILIKLLIKLYTYT